MRRGELCESCGSFSDGSGSVVGCPICGNDVCNTCGNLQLCRKCFANYNAKDNTVVLKRVKTTKFKYTLHSGEEIGEWEIVP